MRNPVVLLSLEVGVVQKQAADPLATPPPAAHQMQHSTGNCDVLILWRCRLCGREWSDGPGDGGGPARCPGCGADRPELAHIAALD